MPPKGSKVAPAKKGEPSKKKEGEKKGKAASGEDAESPKCRKELKIPKKPEGDQEASIDVEEVMGWALQGKVDCDYPDSSKIVRIFTSSTFTDTRAERNALMARVYPKLREYCRERGYDFQVVDMRWGVRDEATDDHMTSELCMRELLKCQQFSTGPNFITFLAQKYGYRPFPAKIDADEFEKILEGVENDTDKTLLTDWFVRDDNIVPPVYQLTPIRQKLPDYANDEDPELKKKARGEWWETFEKMQVILRNASSKQLDEEAAHKYYRAVTEEEIHNGILAVDNADTTCYWFKRTLDGLTESTGDKTARRYMDIADGKPDEEALKFLTKLKVESLTSKLPEDNITEYTVSWTENGVDVEVKEHAEYVDVFCSDFDKVLRSMIDNGIEVKGKQEIQDPLVLEAMGHARFAKQKCAMFHGRNDVLEQLKTKITDPENQTPIVICGEPGAGKTSVMAKVASLLPGWMEDEELRIVVRFLGTSTESSTTKGLLKSLCSQIHRINEEEEKLEEIPSTMKELKEYFCTLLEEQSNRTVLLLDSLDQLRDFGSKVKGWIPKELPENVTVLLSCIPAEEFVVGPELKNHLPEESFLDLPQFSEDDIKEVITEWLKNSGRAIQDIQHDLLVTACAACALPLFAKLSYDSAARWRSYQPVDDCILGQAVEDSIELLFDRVEKYHGVVLVQHALGYVTAAKSGLSTNEIEDILSIDDVVLNDVYQYHTPPLRRLPPLIWVRIQDELDQYLITAGADGVQVITWYHRQFHATARKRYLTEEAKPDLYRVIGEYYCGLWAEGTKDFVDRKGNEGTSVRLVPAMPYLYTSTGEGQSQFNQRKMTELPHALTLSADMDALKEHTFLNFDYLYYKTKARSLDSIFEDMDFAKDNGFSDNEVDLLYACLEMSRDALAVSAELLPSCLLGRLGQKNKKDHPAIHRLLQRAARPNFDCLYSSQGSMKVSGDITLGKFVGHTEHITQMAISQDDKFFVSVSADGTLRVWDIEGIKEQKVIELDEEESGVDASYYPFVMLVNGEKWVACFSGNLLGLFELETGLYVKSIDLQLDENYDIMSKGCLVWSEEHQRLFIMQEGTIDVWDIFEEQKVDTITVRPTAEPDNPNENNDSAKDFIAVYEKDIIYHKAWSNVAKFVRYGTDKKTDSYALYPKKDIPNRQFKFTVMSSGYLLCYNILVQRQHGVVTNGVVDVIDIATARRHHCFMDIDVGYLMKIEHVVATGPDTFAITNHPNGTTAVYNGDVRKKTLTQVMSMTSVFPSKMIATTKNQLILFYLTNMKTMEFLDLSAALAAKESEGAENEDFETPEIYWIVGQLRDTSRYIYCTTITQAIAIWDIYLRRCVRIIDTDFTNMFGCALNPQMVVGSNSENGCFYKADMVEGKIVFKKKDVFFNVIDKQNKQRLSYTGHVVMVGPKENSLCGIDPKTGKIAWTIDAGRETLGGLVVSENGQVAVCETPIPPGTNANEGPKKNSKIHVFDLKAKKKLPDLTYKPTVNPMRTASDTMFAMTPEGDYVCVAVMDENYDYMVYSTKDGKGRRIPLGEHDYATALVYSRHLKAVVLCLLQGEYGVCTLKDLKLSRFKLPKPENPTMSSISNDGCYLAVHDSHARNLIYVVDVVKQCTFACYMADNDVAMTFFSHNNHFLLVASRTTPGLAQLCMYEASKDQAQMGDNGATGGSKEGKQEKLGKKADKPKAGSEKAPQEKSKEKEPNKQAKQTKNDKKVMGDQTQDEKNEGKKTKKTKEDDGEDGASEDDDELGPTMEKQYLEIFGQEEDIFGPPKEFNLQADKD